MVEVQKVVEVDTQVQEEQRQEDEARDPSPGRPVGTAWEWSSKTPFPLEELELLQSQIGSFNAQASRVQESLKRHMGERNRSHLESRQAV